MKQRLHRPGAPRPKLPHVPPAPPRERAARPVASDSSDDLALQPVNADPTVAVKTAAPTATPVRGSLLPSIDTTYLLLLFWGGLVALVFAGLWFFFSEEKPNLPPVSKKSAKNSAVPAGAKNADQPTSLNRRADYLLNPANAKSFFALCRFMEWACSKGLELKGDELAKRLNADVSTQGLDDPDVRELINKQSEYFRLGKDLPLRRLLTSDLTIAGPVSVQLRQINARVKELSLMLVQRYGKPAGK